MDWKDSLLKVLPEILKYSVYVGGLLYAGYKLGGWKRKKSDNTKADFDNRSEISEEWLIKLERVSDIAGKNLMDKEETRGEILRMLRFAEAHFETCERPADDFKKFVNNLKQKYHRNG